ncbi:Oligouridylate-binding protein 1B, partial [Ananas comosus]
YVGNVHVQVTEALLQEVFQSIGPVEGCKLIRKEKDTQSAINDLTDFLSFVIDLNKLSKWSNEF